MKCTALYGLVSILFLTLAACKREQTIAVQTAFSYEVLNDNYSVPVQVRFRNETKGATKYQWTFEGDKPVTSDKKEPGTIQFDEAGTYKVILEAWNEDNRDKKEIVLQLDEAIAIDFEASIEINDFAPATVSIQNKSVGATSYHWTFENGSPATSTHKAPGQVVFNAPGEHTITLQAGNGRKNFTVTKKVVVNDPLLPAFEIRPSFDDDDYEAPFSARLINKTKSGLTWSWSAPGGIINDKNAKEPTIQFNNPGTYTVTLNADNNKETKEVAHTVTILPNTNLRTFTDVRLGINTAHPAVGSFFSTKLRRSFTSTDDLTTAGRDIDITFFGLNENFTYNKFISPDSAQHYTFSPIPQAMKVRLLNALEECMCATTFSVSEFDNMVSDLPLQKLAISTNAEGWKQFTSAVVPRIIIYQTQDGRKGVIKIKQFVKSGKQSYILADIKIQKTP
jgi:PKD repeat protein